MSKKLNTPGQQFLCYPRDSSSCATPGITAPVLPPGQQFLCYPRDNSSCATLGTTAPVLPPGQQLLQWKCMITLNVLFTVGIREKMLVHTVVNMNRDEATQSTNLRQRCEVKRGGGVLRKCWLVENTYIPRSVWCMFDKILTPSPPSLPRPRR